MKLVLRLLHLAVFFIQSFLSYSALGGVAADPVTAASYSHCKLRSWPLKFCLLGARKLRSADAAFELLESFKSIQSRGAIRKQMMNKMNDILQQFRREIDSTTAIFHTLKVCTHNSCCHAVQYQKPAANPYACL